MIVTINTDASWSPTKKGASFAFWIVSNSGKIAKSGIQKYPADSADMAEIRCIINAMYCLSFSKWEGVSKIIINTDSLNSCHVLRNDQAKIKRYRLQGKDFSQLRRKFNKLNPNNIPVEFRHVKAHTTTSTARTWVNQWCDDEAKKQLIKWHQTLKTNEQSNNIQ